MIIRVKIKRYKPFIFKINIFITILILFLSILILISPILPNLSLFMSSRMDKTQGYVYKSHLADSQPVSISKQNLKSAPINNLLLIPNIFINGEIYEGSSAAILNKGIWRRPLSSTPQNGGNTVLVAHRYLYTTGPNTFYHLDKLKMGDKFSIFWVDKEYDYEIFNIKIVQSDDLSIEKNTLQPIITLYTCTPLWTSKDRLVITAKLITTNPKDI